MSLCVKEEKKGALVHSNIHLNYVLKFADVLCCVCVVDARDVRGCGVRLLFSMVADGRATFVWM